MYIYTLKRTIIVTFVKQVKFPCLKEGKEEKFLVFCLYYYYYYLIINIVIIIIILYRSIVCSFFSTHITTQLTTQAFSYRRSNRYKRFCNYKYCKLFFLTYIFFLPIYEICKSLPLPLIWINHSIQDFNLW